MPKIGEVKKASHLGYKGHCYCMWVKCDECGKEWWTWLNKGVKSKCRSCSLKGKVFLEETKEKLRLKALGNINGIGKRSPEFSRKKSKYWHEHFKDAENRMRRSRKLKGRLLTSAHKKKLSENHRIVNSLEQNAKISKSLMGKYAGELAPNWMGGLSFEPYSSAFNQALKGAIRLRDGYKCQLCGVPEFECITKLAIHHINYDKTDCSEGNLIALCNSCNGKVNINRDYWEYYFKGLFSWCTGIQVKVQEVRTV